jgi:putative membrane protein
MPHSHGLPSSSAELTAAALPGRRIPHIVTDVSVPLMLIVCGSVIAWLSRDFPAELPVWAPWRFSWSEFLAAALGLWWYLHGVALSPSEERPSSWRILSFVLGVALTYAVLQTDFDYVAQHAFFLHRVQHLVMHHLGPFLIALAWPGNTIWRGMPGRVRKIFDSTSMLRVLWWVQQPAIAAFLFVGLIYLWLVPSIHFHAMLDYRLYDLMNWSMVVDGLLFWCLVLDPRPAPPARISFLARMITVLAVLILQVPLGLYLAFTPDDLYKSYDICGRLLPGIGALHDQHLGGFIIAVPASMMSLVAFVVLLDRSLREAG